MAKVHPNQIATVTTIAPTDDHPPSATDSPRIERLILHHLDHRANTLRLVAAPVALDPRCEAFFVAHLTAASQRADWRAHFSADDADAIAVAALCRQLLDPIAFVAASQELAHRLFERMRARPRQIAPGDFVALVYTRAARPHIALLKLDPDVRLVRDFSRVDGHLRVTIRAADNLLPGAESLQKCALLRHGPDDEFEVTLLDTQAGPRSEGVAAFFYRGFLAVTLAPSARRRTRLFLTASERWLADRRDTLPPRAILRFYRARRAALRAERLDLAAFAADALPGAAEEQRALLDALIAALFAGEPPAPDFLIDRATADPVVRYVTLELDSGARLRVEADRFDALVRVEERRADAKLRLTLETVTLKEVGGL